MKIYSSKQPPWTFWFLLSGRCLPQPCSVKTRYLGVVTLQCCCWCCWVGCFSLVLWLIEVPDGQYTRPRMEALLLFVQHVSSFKHWPLIYCKVLHPVVGLNPTLMSICVLNHHGKLTTTSLYLILRTFVCFHGNFCLWNYIGMNIIMWMNATMYHIRFAAGGELFRAMCKEEDECRSPANWTVKSRFWIQMFAGIFDGCGNDNGRYNFPRDTALDSTWNVYVGLLLEKLWKHQIFIVFPFFCGLLWHTNGFCARLKEMYCRNEIRSEIEHLSQYKQQFFLQCGLQQVNWSLMYILCRSLVGASACMNSVH